MLGITASFLLSLFLIIDHPEWIHRFQWMLGFDLGWKLDSISLLLIFLVCLISSLVHAYSLSYIKKEEQPRYFLKLGFFTSSMLGLLLADHLILIFIFWELVGFFSYLLIGFWYKKPDAAESAKWAFITNRFSDVFLLSGILCLGLSDSFFISEISPISSYWIGLGLVVGVMGKSAQFPLSAWLPRAMTGPTPVSALLHAATMVTVGVYLLIRIEIFLSVDLLRLVVAIGLVTALFGAYSAISQHDIKKIFAYSTISQLGFMFLAVGVGSVGAAFFHLWTHAFFKAGLFLMAGWIITISGSQDIRNMNQVHHSYLLKILNGIFIASLIGMPLFTGFFSKEAILSAIWQWGEDMFYSGHHAGYLVFYLTIFIVALTAFYGTRQWIVTHKLNVSEEPRIRNIKTGNLIILVVLALCSLWFAVSLNPFSNSSWILNYSKTPIIHGHTNLTILSICLGLIGGGIAFIIYHPSRMQRGSYKMVSVPVLWFSRFSYFGWSLDALFRKVSKGYLSTSRSLYYFDSKILDKSLNILGISWVVTIKFIGTIDRFVVDGVAKLVAYILAILGDQTRRMQSPFIQHQIIWMLIGLILLIIFFGKL